MEDFKIADLQVLGAVIRPFERIFDPNDATKYVLQPSEHAFDENWAAYEKLRKQNDIKLINSHEDLTETKYMDYKLNFFYKLVGGDIIKSLEDIDKMYEKGIRVIQLVDQINNHLCPCFKTAKG
ncbi:membrane dipeptidase [Patescibacteria group bacterium]|nr:membrane dipeptidase [Patescibacteria group bacterium]MBU1758685.1 membrane dipeptidase [Patescibacteria group bacterium]